MIWKIWFGNYNSGFGNYDLKTITADLETTTADLETMIWKLWLGNYNSGFGNWEQRIWQLWSGNYNSGFGNDGLETKARDLETRTDDLETMIWKLWFGNYDLETMIWKLWGQIWKLGTTDAETMIWKVSLGNYEVWFGTSGFGNYDLERFGRYVSETMSWKLWMGNFCSRPFQLSVYGHCCRNLEHKKRRTVLVSVLVRACARQPDPAFVLLADSAAIAPLDGRAEPAARNSGLAASCFWCSHKFSTSLVPLAGPPTTFSVSSQLAPERPAFRWSFPSSPHFCSCVPQLASALSTQSPSS